MLVLSPMNHLKNKKNKYAPSLPLKIVMYLTFISLIPLLLLSFFSYNISYTGIKELSNAYIFHFVAEKKSRVNLFFRDLEIIIHNIENLGETKILLTSDNTSLEGIALRSQIKGEISNFALSDGVISVDLFNQNEIIAHVGTTLRHDSVNVELQEFLFQSAIKANKDIYWAGIQDNIHNNSHEKNVLTGVKPIKYVKKIGNKITTNIYGFILLQFDLEIFYNEFYEKNQFSGYSIIFDQYGHIIYHPNKNQIGEHVDPLLIDQLKQNMSINNHTVYFNDKFVIFDQLLKKNWFVAHFVSDATYTDRIHPIFYYSLFLFAICFAIIFITVFFFYYTILSPIIKITNRFRKLQQSDADAQLKIKNKYPNEIGELVHWFNIFIESTIEKNNSEIALKESEERFKALHNASFGGIAIHDQGLILECNKGLSSITGFSYEELVGMNGLLLISEETRDKVMHNIKTGYEKSYEAIGVRKNGEKYPIRLEARNIPYKNKNVRVVEFRDISEKKRAAAEKENLENQLRQSQKMEAVGRLAGGVAHDFNNMLSVIIGHVEIALEQTHPSMEIYSGLIEIMSAANRSADLTRQLLAFARQQTVAPKLLDLNKTVNEMLNMLKRLIGEDVDLIWKNSEHVYPIKIDPSQLDQILANLCLNARDSILGVGKIIIETHKVDIDEIFCETHAETTPGTYICLEVSDDGKGMDKQTLANIFEPFFTTKSIGKGTGLGLATVHGIVKQNNGFFHVYSELGKGTSFKIYLPYYWDKDAVQKSEKDQPKSVPGGNETILLVEDQPNILKMIDMILKRLGYQVLSANSPGKAIHLAKNHEKPIDLLITDVIMPEMNGKDLAERLVLISPNLKCLFMSGYTADVIAHHGVLDENISFVQKPFSKKVLAVKVREILD